MTLKTEMNLGKLVDADAPVDRDAVHIPVVPVKAGMLLKAGQHVGLNTDGEAVTLGTRIGVVDPFLREPVPHGARFFLFIYPGSITDLTHHWAHASFKEKEKNEEGKQALREWSTRWIRDFADEINRDYADLMGAAIEYAETGEPMEVGQGWQHISHHKWPKFWEHFENLTGIKNKNAESVFKPCC